MWGQGKAMGTPLKSLVISLPTSIIPPVTVPTFFILFLYFFVCPSVSFLPFSAFLFPSMFVSFLFTFRYFSVCLSLQLSLPPPPTPLPCLPLAL